MKKFNVILVAMMLTASATNVFAVENPASELSAEMLNKKPKKTVQQTAQQEEPFTKAEYDAGLIVFGEGASKTEATTAALRSAIEQTYGVFVSSNTTILNDEQVKDEVVSLSSGNIRHYEYISEAETDGKYYVSIKAFVSVGKLADFAKSKGSEVELAGLSLLVDEKMKKLENENRQAAMRHLTAQLYAISGSIWDYEIAVSEAKPYYIETRQFRSQAEYDNMIKSGNYKEPDAAGFNIDIKVLAKPNDNVKVLHDLYVNTMKEISTNWQATAYERMCKELMLKYPGLDIDAIKERTHIKEPEPEKIYEMAQHSGLDTFLLTLNMVRNMCSFKISDGINEYIYAMGPINNIHTGQGGYFCVYGECNNFTNTKDISITRMSPEDILYKRDDYYLISNRFYSIEPYFIKEILVNGRCPDAYSFTASLKYSAKTLETITKISVHPVPLNNTTYINVEDCFDAEIRKDEDNILYLKRSF